LTRALPYHRGFQRWSPTKFFIDLFNETFDQRFYSSFKNAWYCNNPASATVWPETLYIDDGTTVDVDPDLVGQPMFGEGDTALRFFKKPVDPSNRARTLDQNSGRYSRWGFHSERGYVIFDINDMYNEDETVNFLVNDRQFYFPIIGKYSAPDRLEVSQMYSGRYAFVIRISDMYLVSAEAALMQSNNTKAYNRLEALANARAINGNGAELLSAYGVNGAGDVNIDFILDERARDLATEDYRFFDLKRTGKLEERIQNCNPEAAANYRPYHALRPIPKMQLDAFANKSDSYQNPGYK
jgi:hypothetical protein